MEYKDFVHFGVMIPKAVHKKLKDQKQNMTQAVIRVIQSIVDGTNPLSPRVKELEAKVKELEDKLARIQSITKEKA